MKNYDFMFGTFGKWRLGKCPPLTQTSWNQRGNGNTAKIDNSYRNKTKNDKNDNV